MEDLCPRLRKLVEEHPEKNLSKISRESGVPYFRLRDFMNDRGVGLRGEQINKLHIFLTGEPLRLGTVKRKEVA